MSWSTPSHHPDVRYFTDTLAYATDDDATPGFDTEGLSLVRIKMPSAWTSTPNVSVQGSRDGTTWEAIYDDAHLAVSFATPTAAQSYQLTPEQTRACDGWYKLRVVTSAAQAADRAFIFDMRRFA